MDSNTVIFSASLRKCPIPNGKIHTCVWIFPLQSVLILIVGIFTLKCSLRQIKVEKDLEEMPAKN